MISPPLLELGDWGIFKAHPKEAVSNVGLYAIHLTCLGDLAHEYLNDQNAIDNVSWIRGEAGGCWNCKNPVPDEIQALMTLHDWNGLDETIGT